MFKIKSLKINDFKTNSVAQLKDTNIKIDFLSSIEY